MLAIKLEGKECSDKSDGNRFGGVVETIHGREDWPKSIS
jgi:hypothetical protein